MTAPRPLPAPVLPPSADIAALSSYGAPLLQAIGVQQAAEAQAAGQGLVDALARIALALQATDPRALRRREGWWGRLLGRDVVRQALQAQLGVLALQAREQAQAVRVQGEQRREAIIDADAAALALQAWGEHAGALLPQLPVDAQAALTSRIDHLQRLAALHRIDAGQWRLLQAQDAALLERFARIHDVLLPAWRQATLNRQLQAQSAQVATAAALQVQIHDEVAAAQARLR
ncbi:MAG: hypothetical protein RR704_16470 [Stenotrophomonas sp.]